MQPKLLIIDGHNFLFKAYGVPFKFNSTKGTPLHVVTGFLSLIKRTLKIVSNNNNCSIAVIFDTESKSSNSKLSETYKTNRKTDYSQDLDSPFKHLEYILKVLKFLNIKVYKKKGVEADDIIASLVSQFLIKHKNGKVYIASSDSDFYQLLSNNTAQIILGKKGAYSLFTPKELKQKLGISPKEYVYFKSLTGDKADNISGIPNIGPVKARMIIKRELKLDLSQYENLIKLNQKLIELNKNINVCKNLSALILKTKRLELKNSEIFQKLNF